MTDLEEITVLLRKFRDERNWEQFHNAKDLALAISIESGELLEQFLWKNADEADQNKIKEELADVFIFALLLANNYAFDIKQIILEKVKINEKNYPIDKAKGIAKKYTDL